LELPRRVREPQPEAPLLLLADRALAQGAAVLRDAARGLAAGRDRDERGPGDLAPQAGAGGVEPFDVLDVAPGRLQLAHVVDLLAVADLAAGPDLPCELAHLLAAQVEHLRGALAPIGGLPADALDRGQRERGPRDQLVAALLAAGQCLRRDL